MYYCSFSLIVALLFCCHTFGSTTQRRTVREAGINTCTTPNGTSGNCVPVTQCAAMQDLLKRAPNHIFFKQSLCGSTGENQKNVCCSVHGINKGSTTATAPKDYSVCGKRVSGDTKFGGVLTARLGGFPWHVALGYRRENDPNVLWNCEGALIADRWVLTAGHCISHRGNLRLTTARIGDLDLDDDVNDGASPIDVEVDNIIPHPQFELDPLTNDIALVRLKNPVIFNKYVRPVCMLNEDLHKSSDSFYNDRQLILAGWSSILYPGQVGSSTILEVTLAHIVNRDLCTQEYRQLTRSPIDMRSLCVKRNLGDCQDFPGGPALVSIKNTLYLAGILSFHSGCTYDYPRVYTKVAYYSDWIANVTRIRF